MMSKEEALHILISPEAYRTNKANTLMGQADLLETLKKLYNLEVLARQKQDLKKRLHKLFTMVLSSIDSLQDQMPKPKIPKSIQKEEVGKMTTKKDFSKQTDIEEELMSIQEKLKELNR